MFFMDIKRLGLVIRCVVITKIHLRNSFSPVIPVVKDIKGFCGITFREQRGR